MSVAATTFTTLDDLGCWLLRQHPRLEEVQCSTAGAGPNMSWQRQLHQHEELQEPAVPDAADLCDIRLRCANSQTCVANDLTAFARQNTGSRSSNAGGSIDASWLSHLSRYLGIYSSRPASLLLHHISGITLTLHDKDISNLNQLLQSLKYLKSLEVRQRAACISTSEVAVCTALCTCSSARLCVATTINIYPPSAAGSPMDDSNTSIQSIHTGC